MSPEELRQENRLLKQYVCDLLILRDHQRFAGEPFRRASNHEQRHYDRVYDIVTNNECLDLWDHLYPEGGR